MNAVLDVVRKNHDQAGLASRFRTEKPKLEAVPIVAVEDLTVESFRSSYVDHNLPVMVKGALTKEWKCMESWDVEYLKETVGHVELPVRANPSANGTFGSVKRLADGEVSLYDFDRIKFLDFLNEIGTESAKYYPARVELCNELPEIVPDVPSFYDLPWRFAFGRPYKNGTIAYFGPGNQTTPLHYDTLENLTFMLSGSKTFQLYPPYLAPLLSPSPRSFGTHYSLLAPTSAAEIEETHFEVTLHAGDMLYLPTCWWHCVHGGEGFNISLNYWFCQHSQKEYHSAFHSYLTASFERTLKQLQSMKLPQSVLEEAEKEAASTIETKINHKKCFDWNAIS